MENTLRAANTAAPNAAIASVQLQMTGDQPTGRVTLATPDARQLGFNARTGAPVPVQASPRPAERPLDLHLILLQIHREFFAGTGGSYVDVVCGAALSILCITGIVLYGDMFARRIRLGRKALFWK